MGAVAQPTYHAASSSEARYEPRHKPRAKKIIRYQRHFPELKSFQMEWLRELRLYSWLSNQLIRSATWIFGRFGYQIIKASGPNYTLWRRVQQLRVAHAACLLSDIEPIGMRVPVGDAYAWHTILKEAIKNGQLGVIDLEGTEPNVRTLVDQDELRRFVETLDQRPRFLYPDDGSA